MKTIQFKTKINTNSRGTAENIVDELKEKEYCGKSIAAKIWENHGYTRVYVDGFHYEKKFYIDCDKKEIVPSLNGAQTAAIEIMKNIVEII